MNDTLRIFLEWAGLLILGFAGLVVFTTAVMGAVLIAMWIFNKLGADL